MYTVTCNDNTVQNVKHVPDEELLGRRFLWISAASRFLRYLTSLYADFHGAEL